MSLIPFKIGYFSSEMNIEDARGRSQGHLLTLFLWFSSTQDLQQEACLGLPALSIFCVIDVCSLSIPKQALQDSHGDCIP